MFYNGHKSRLESFDVFILFIELLAYHLLKEESSEDEEDDEMDVEADEEEEEHQAPADSVVVAPTAADQAPSAEETEPFETDELLAISSPPASPLSPWSSPPQIPSPPLPPILSPPSPILAPVPPPSPIRSLGYRAAMIRLRDEAASTSHSPPSQLPSASRIEDRLEVTLPPRKRLDIALGPRISILAPVPMPAWTDSEVVRLLAISSPPASPLSPWSSPPPQIPFPPLPSILSPPSPLPSTIRREDRPEVTLPPRKRLDIALGPRYEVGESSSAAAARPAGGLRADYGFVATMDREIVRDPEREARMSREAWVRATDASDLVHCEVMSQRTTVLGQMSEIRKLQAADHRR
nr:hypothetical protein [Tanacetum cinerariifolium]